MWDLAVVLLADFARAAAAAEAVPVGPHGGSIAADERQRRETGGLSAGPVGWPQL